MTTPRATIELINPAAFRSHGTVKPVAASERPRPQNSSANDAVPKGQPLRAVRQQPLHALDAAKSLLQTEPLLAAQTAGTAATMLPHAGTSNPQGVQAYRQANGDLPEPINILVDWKL